MLNIMKEDLIGCGIQLGIDIIEINKEFNPIFDNTEYTH